MSNPQLVRDSSGAPVQALRPAETAALSVSGTTARVAVPSGSNIARLAATGDVHVAFGDSSVEATTSSMFFPAGVEVFNAIAYTHVAAIAASGVSSATLTVTRLT